MAGQAHLVSDDDDRICCDLDRIDPTPSEIICGRLYLGSKSHARKVASGINPCQITHVLNVSEDILLLPGKTKSGVIAEWVPMRDDGTDDVFGPLEDSEEDACQRIAFASASSSAPRVGAWWLCRSFLQNAFNCPSSCVLVHCALGVNRSATIVIAWLMETQGLPALRAMQIVKSRRSVVNPIFSHRSQLEKFQVDILHIPVYDEDDDDCFAGFTCCLACFEGFLAMPLTKIARGKTAGTNRTSRSRALSKKEEDEEPAWNKNVLEGA